MPRSKKRTASAAGKKSAGPEPAAAEAEPVDVTEARGRRTRGSASASPAPKKAARTTSASPAPKSRSKSSKPEPEPTETKRGRSRQGRGDVEEESSKGRVTRAVIKEAEEPPQPRGRSTTRKAATKAQEPSTPSRSSTRQKSTPAKSTEKEKAPPARGGRSRSARGKKEVEVEEEEEEEEDEEEEEEEVKPKPTPKSKSRRAQTKATPKKTPAKKTPKKATPASKKKTSAKSPAKSRSRSRGGKEESSPNDPQVLLTKIDSPSKEADKKSPSPKKVATPSPKQSRTPRRTPKSTEKSPPSSGRSRRSRRSTEPEKEEENKEVTETGDKETGSKEDVTQEEEKTEPEDKADDSKVDTEEKETEDEPEESKEDSEVVENTTENIEAEPEESKVESESENMEDEPKEIQVDSESVEKTTENIEDKPESKVDSEQIESTAENIEDEPEESPEENESVESLTEKTESEHKNEPEEVEVQKTEEQEEEPMEPEPAKEDIAETKENALEEISGDEMQEEKEGEMENESVENVDTEEIKPQENSHGNGDIQSSDSTKRKFDEVQEDEEDEPDDTISSKKAKLSEVEEDVPQTNGGEELVESEGKAIENDVEDEMEVEEVGQDYVMVNMDEVPAADSSEISQSVPQEGAVTGGNVEETVIESEVQEEQVEEVESEEKVMEATTQERTSEIQEVVEEPIQRDVYVPLENPEIAQESVHNEVLPSQTEDKVQSTLVNDQSSITVPSSQFNLVLNRKFTKNMSYNLDSSDTGKHFSVVTYNILAQCHLERNDYTFTDSKFLTQNYRYDKMFEELQYLDGDVVCLQEVGTNFYAGMLEPAMKSLGYEGVMKKRTDDYYEEGEATFYKTSRFDLDESNIYSLTDLSNKELDEGFDDMTREAVQNYLRRPDVFILHRLRCKYSGSIVTVGNIHVHWGKMEVPDVQCIQIASAIKEIVRKAGSDFHPHIFCGDFNSEVSSAGYQLCTDGYLSDDMIHKLQKLEKVEFPDKSKASLLNLLWRAFQHTSSSLKSAYATTQGAEPEITSYNRVMKAAVDYLFYSANCLDVVGVLEVPSNYVVTETGGIPNEMFPSDHVSLKAVFSFR